MKRVSSLRARLALWIFLPTLLISAVDLAITYESTEKVAALVQQQLLKGSARIISEKLTEIDGGYEISIPPAALELFASQYKDRIFYAVRSRDGVLIAGNQDLAAYTKPLAIETEKYFLSEMRGEPVRVIAYAHALPNATSGNYAITQVAQTLNSYRAFQTDLFLLTIREHLLFLIVVLVILFIAIRWTLRPLMEFGARLLERKPGLLEKIDKDLAPQELGPVIAAMNDYVTRLDATLKAYEEFVANTAHHLRTSFAIINSQIDFGKRAQPQTAAQAEVLEAIRETVSHGTKVINQLLVLAAVEQKRLPDMAVSVIDLGAMAASVIEMFAPVAHTRQIELGLDAIDSEVRIQAPAFLVQEVISNLIDNAIQHMGKAGSVSVAIENSGAGAVLSVTDSGPGIAEELRQAVFERFYRIDQGRQGGSGLGLAIVKETCDALGASVTLSTPASGIGLKVSVQFASRA